MQMNSLIFKRKVVHLPRFESEGFWNWEMVYCIFVFVSSDYIVRNRCIEIDHERKRSANVLRLSFL